MTDLLVPIGRVGGVPVAGNIPTTLAGQVQVNMTKHEQIDEAVRLLGPSAKPSLPILLMDENHRVSTVIMTDGITEMAELAEIAHYAIERREDTLKRTGQAFDFERARHNAGMPSAAKFDENLRNALADRVAKHKANPVSDPPRQAMFFDEHGNKTTVRPDAKMLFDMHKKETPSG